MQCDPTGPGIMDTDIIKQGWVPSAGHLLETNVPVTLAIAEATAKNGSPSGSLLIFQAPILPLSIILASQ